MLVAASNRAKSKRFSRDFAVNQVWHATCNLSLSSGPTAKVTPGIPRAGAEQFEAERDCRTVRHSGARPRSRADRA
jgi:hypothetical protein